MIVIHKDGMAVMQHSVRKIVYFGDKWDVLVDNEIFVSNITEKEAIALVEEIKNRFIEEEQARMTQEGKMSHDIYNICDEKTHDKHTISNEYRDMLDETLASQGEVDR